jgi:membrane associated rhomboid family serine protease
LDQTDTPPIDQPRPEREPLFNAPWPIVFLPALLIVLYAVQSVTIGQTQDNRWGVSSTGLAAGHWETLLTSLFLHGGWTHVIMNSVALLAFGPPSARLLGIGARGATTFFAFYLTCGVLGSLGFLAAASHDTGPLVGASGAIAGLLGGAARIIQGHGRIGPMFGRTVLAMTAAWAVANVVLGVSGWTPGAAGMPVAWQAHLAGYLAGLLLIGPFARLAGAGSDAFTQ